MSNGHQRIDEMKMKHHEVCTQHEPLINSVYHTKHSHKVQVPYLFLDCVPMCYVYALIKAKDFTILIIISAKVLHPNFPTDRLS